ncbi:MAG: hypothetical protein MJB14_04705 [Spirochaetes bacterium]|nr:hypothetical protein [Spirochaetota bacterium]
MKKRKFQFDKILKLKEHDELKAKQAYAEQLQKKISLEQQNVQLEKEVYQALKEDFDSASKGDQISHLEILLTDHFSQAAHIRMNKNDEQKESMKDHLEDLRGKLTIAMQEKKKIEKLAEKEQKKYKEELKKEEIKKLDDTNYTIRKEAN